MKYVNSRTGLVGAALAVVVLAGGSTAAVAHGYGASIGSEDIRNESIYSQDIKNGQVRTGEIRDGNVFEVDLSQEVKDLITAGGEKGEQGEPGAQGPAGPAGADSTVPGPKGDKGDTGEAGADGQDGVANPETDGTYHDLAESAEVQVFTVDCAGDKVATGGGFSVDFPQHRANVRFVGSTPADFTEIEGDAEGSVVAHGWEVQVINEGPATSLRTWVACATAN